MPRKQKTGVVVSDKMQKSVVVEVTRTKKHPLYKKYVRIRKRYMAHDETNQAHVGDFVKIEESRPLSAHKRWALIEVVRTAHGGATVGHVATAANREVEQDLMVSAPAASLPEADNGGGAAVADEPIYETPAEPADGSGGSEPEENQE